LEIAKNTEEVMYRCAPEKEMLLGTDSNKNYIFLKMRDVGRVYTESLFLIHQKSEEEKQVLELIEIDLDGSCKYFYDVCPLGLIFVRFRKIN